MRKFLLSIFVLSNFVVNAQLFQQNFQSSAVVADYVSATPSNGQFNAISTSGAGTTVSIATVGTNNVLRFTRTGGNAGSFSRTTDFAPVQNTLMYKFDITVNGTTATTSAAVFQVGNAYGTANSPENNVNTYARLAINTTATPGTFVIRDITTGTNSAPLTGTQTITWVLNNSGSQIAYTNPAGNQSTLANDRADIFAGTVLLFDDVVIQTASQTITDLKFVFNNGDGSIDIDNLLIDPLTAGGPLPVKFSGVKAYQKSGGVSIQWDNLTETEVTNYILERSSNGRNFTEVVQVHPAKNDGSKVSYQYLDPSPANGINFYRIKATEGGGKIFYSELIKMSIGETNTSLLLYPNPIKGNKVGLQLNNLKAGNYTIRIYTNTSQVVAARMLNHAGGSFTESIDLNNLKPGVYTMEINGSVKLKKQFVVQ